MRVVVKRVFVDKITNEQYKVGDVLNISNTARVKDMLAKNLINPIEVAEEPKKATGKKRG